MARHMEPRGLGALGRQVYAKYGLQKAIFAALLGDAEARCSQKASSCPAYPVCTKAPFCLCPIPPDSLLTAYKLWINPRDGSSQQYTTKKLVLQG